MSTPVLSRVLLSCLLWLISGGWSPLAAQQVPVEDVEPQPLASNLRRVLQALEALGHPLEQTTEQALLSAIDSQESAAMQWAIDAAVLAVVTLSPEERVSAQRGPAAAVLQQAGYLPVILKVINHSSSTPGLRITSPQAGPVYAGAAVFSMQRQQQTDLTEHQNEEQASDRFLAVDVHTDPPMTAQLSGLQVEYCLALLASSQAGKREAVLHFDVGDGTADLEHRNELPVLFTARPALPLRLKITDSDDSPSIARLEFRDQHGRVYPLQPKREAPDFFFQSQVYRGDGEVVLLPPGTFTVQTSRGPEYHVQQGTLRMIAGATNELVVDLQRWFDASEHGYFSGDHHIHAAGCAHYTHPTEGVSPQDMFRQVRGEGLNVGCVLTWGPCFDHQRKYFAAQADMFGTRDTLLKYDLEISGFGSEALGHVCLLNLHDQTYPGSEGTKTKGWPTWTTPVMRWAKEQGGYAGYAHSASGLAIDPLSASKRLIERWDADHDGALQHVEVSGVLLPTAATDIDSDDDERLTLDELKTAHERAAEQLPNLAIPEMNGVGAMEICVSSVAGVCDFISAMDTRRIQEWNTWYHLLNCGFPLKVSGETDFPCMSSRRVGQGRVYVHLGQGYLEQTATLDFATWCRGLAEGKSYVSDGYAHVPSLSVAGVAPGYGDVQLATAGSVHVQASVTFAPQTPAAVAHGTQVGAGGRAVAGDTVILHRQRSDEWVRGGEREVEIVVNGIVAAKQTVPADGQLHELAFDIPIAQSSWVALRHFPQLHSNPVNVIVAGRPIRASRDSARWCIEMTELLWKNRHKKIAAAERAEAEAAFQRTFDVLRRIAEES